MARKQRVVADLKATPAEAVEICRRGLLERGCEMLMVSQERIKGRVPGNLLRKYVMYELTLTPKEGSGTTVEIATWTSNIFSTPNDLVGRAARELSETLRFADSRRD